MPFQRYPKDAVRPAGLAAWLAVAGVAAAATTDLHAQAPTREAPAEWLSACDRGAERAWCGTYEVWEDRVARAGRRIGLYVMVIPAESETPAPDALVWLEGGPGGAATHNGPNIGGALTAARADRDLLLVDQRGTGRSHALNCPRPADDAPLQEHFEEFLPQDRVRACLSAQDADVTMYTTPIATDDLNEVREALGYDQISIFGGSYGSRAGLIYLRRHPETVRVAVLKSVAPTNMRNPLPFARALDSGLQGIFDACSAEADCARAYPRLESEWERVAEQFEKGPVTARVTHAGRTEDVTISKGVFADGIRHILSEDLQFVTEDEIRRETDGTFMGDYRVRRQLDACEIWGSGDIDESYLAPVMADVPMLLMSGEFDTGATRTGASWVAEYVPKAVQVIVPNESHGFANAACEFGVIDRFIANAGPEGLDADCIYETRRLAFRSS